jgi:hypothetical protein
MQKILSLLNITTVFPAKEETQPRPTFSSKVVVRVKSSTAPSSRVGTRAVVATLSPISFRWIAVGLVLLNTVLFVTYLFSVNTQANTGYTIKQIEKRIAEQTALNKKLTVQASEATSIASVQQSAEQSQFIPITASDSMYVQVEKHLSKK